MSIFDLALRKGTQMTAKKNLAALVDEAVANELELRRLQSIDGALTPRAYLEACAAAPGASAKEADAIEKALDGPEGELINPSLRRMSKAIAHMNRTAPITKLGGYMDAEADSTLARATRQSLFFVAGRRPTARPELFGTMTKPNEFGDAIAKCKAERERLRAEISTGWTAHDVVVDRDGASFRMTGGIVKVAENLAENLLNFALTESVAEAA